jgi:hypothetical protein
MDNQELSREARAERVRHLRALKQMPLFQALVAEIDKEAARVTQSILSPAESVGELIRREQDIGLVRGLRRLTQKLDEQITELTENE